MAGCRKINVQQKSTFSTPPPRKSAIAKVVSKDGEINVHLSIVNGDGKKGELQYTASYDGKNYPISGSPLFNAIALKLLDDHTDQVVYKKDSKVIRTSKRTVSADGRVLTITDENASGKGATSVSVWNRQ